MSSSTVLVRDGADRRLAVSSSFNATANRITISLREPWQATTYTVTLGTGIKDLAGNALAAPYTFSLRADPPGQVRRRLHSRGKQYGGPRAAYNELARQAAEGVRLAVKPAASPVPSSGISSEAELALREGAHFSNRYNNLHHSTDFESAFTAFTRGLQSDPPLAAAAAQISQLYLFRYEAEGGAGGALKDTDAWARRALEIDRRCGRAWSMLSRLEAYSAKPDVERQLDYALKAASFSPRDALSHMTVSNSVQSLGATSLQLAASLWAVGLDAFYLPASGNVVFDLSALGRAEETLPFADRAMRVEPDAWSCLITEGCALVKLGRLEEARITLAREEAQFFENPTSDLSQMWGQIRFELAVAERDAATSRSRRGARRGRARVSGLAVLHAREPLEVDVLSEDDGVASRRHGENDAVGER